MNGGIYPYNDGSGSTGDGASRDRELRLDSSGETAHRQAYVYAAVRAAGRDGITSREICHRFDLTPNQVSPPLTILHGAGYIACLKERRTACHIYVLPEHVDARPTRPPGRHNAISDQVREDVRELVAWLDDGAPGTFPSTAVARLRIFGGLL